MQTGTIFPVLQTPRLQLIEIIPAHAESLFRLFTNKRVTDFYQAMPLQQPADAQKIVQMLAQRYNEQTGIRWGIALKGGQQFIGTIGFNSYTKGHRSTLVFAIMPEYWGNGYVTEAIKEMVRYGFDVLGVNRIEAEVMPGNIASEKVLVKAGFKHEGMLHHWMLWDGRHYDINMYALLKQDGY